MVHPFIGRHVRVNGLVLNVPEPRLITKFVVPWKLVIRVSNFACVLASYGSTKEPVPGLSSARRATQISFPEPVCAGVGLGAGVGIGRAFALSIVTEA